MSDKYELSRRKALAALGTIGVAGAGAGLGTSALFSDEESFENNSITAGTANLAVTLGLAYPYETTGIDSTATAEDLEFSLDGEDDTPTADGEVRTGLTVGDMKPGDCIVLRATVDVQDNPMYVAVTGDDLSESGGVETEPELEVAGDNSGDLAENLEITFGYDSARGSLHGDSLDGQILPDPGPQSTYTGTEFVNNAVGGFVYRGRNDFDGDPPGGHGSSDAHPTRIGDPSMSLTDRDKVTHFIEICLPSDVGNEIQGDTVSFDLVWSAEQVRNNPAPSSASEVDGSSNSS